METLHDGIAGQVAAEKFDVRTTRASSPPDAIVAIADAFDAVVMGDSDPS